MPGHHGVSLAAGRAALLSRSARSRGSNLFWKMHTSESDAGDDFIRHDRKKAFRRAALFVWGVVLMIVGVVVMDSNRGPSHELRSEPSVTWNGEVVLLSLPALLQDDAKPIWTPKSIAAVKQLFQKNPDFLEQWAKLTGSTGKVLLAKVKGKPPVYPPHFSQLDKDLSQLDTSIIQLSSTTQDQGSDTTWLPHVNSRAAFLMVSDLSKDWDAHTNYSSTPWEFCAGRELSDRQIRECAEHLISAAGVPSHRDLELDSKVRPS
jgi:hypothetical protein